VAPALVIRRSRGNSTCLISSLNLLNEPVVFPRTNVRAWWTFCSSLSVKPLAEIESAWTKEIERRVHAHARGEVDTFAAEDVFAEARRIAP
jgi:hypothetical protein